MPDNKYVIDDILDAVVNEKPVDLQAAVNSLMVAKAHDYIENMKAVVMQDMMKSPEEGETEDEDSEEETNEGEETEELDADEIFNDEETDEEETDNQG